MTQYYYIVKYLVGVPSILDDELSLIGENPSVGQRLVKWKIREKYKNVFIDVVVKNPAEPDKATSYIAVNKMNGDAFHLITIAGLLAKNKTILGVEANAKVQFKKSVLGSAKQIGKPLERRVDIVTGDDINSALWHEVKSLAFNTKRDGGKENKSAYKNALGTLDLPTITTIKRVTVTEDLAVLGEDSEVDLVVKSNQFYTKEFFVDRVYAGADTNVVANKISWILQDYAKGDMNTFDSRSVTKKLDLVVAKSKFLQCGVNKSTSGTCGGVYGAVNPLDDIREKLLGGIRSSTRPDVLDIVRYTFPNNQFDDHDDVKSYISMFMLKKNALIYSENSKDWLLNNAAENISASCGVNE